MTHEPLQDSTGMRDVLQLWEKALTLHKNCFGSAMRHMLRGRDIAKRFSVWGEAHARSRHEPPPGMSSGVGSFQEAGGAASSGGYNGAP